MKTTTMKNGACNNTYTEDLAPPLSAAFALTSKNNSDPKPEVDEETWFEGAD